MSAMPAIIMSYSFRLGTIMASATRTCSCASSYMAARLSSSVSSSCLFLFLDEYGGGGAGGDWRAGNSDLLDTVDDDTSGCVSADDTSGCVSADEVGV